jgi:hypothetical protein
MTTRLMCGLLWGYKPLIKATLSPCRFSYLPLYFRSERFSKVFIALSPFMYPITDVLNKLLTWLSKHNFSLFVCLFGKSWNPIQSKKKQASTCFFCLVSHSLFKFVLYCHLCTKIAATENPTTASILVETSGPNRWPLFEW